MRLKVAIRIAQGGRRATERRGIGGRVGDGGKERRRGETPTSILVPEVDSSTVIRSAGDDTHGCGGLLLARVAAAEDRFGSPLLSRWGRKKGEIPVLGYLLIWMQAGGWIRLRCVELNASCKLVVGGKAVPISQRSWSLHSEATPLPLCLS
jgi:hypothetical protein